MNNATHPLSRLREAREGRGMSLEDLAEKLGTSKQLVYKYEHALLPATPAAIARFSAALRVPPSFFSRPAPLAELAPTFFRHFRSKTSAKHLAAVERQLGWSQKFVEVLDEFVVLPPVNIPDFRPPSDPRDIMDRQIEECATAVRQHWGFADGVIRDVIRLVESNGCVVVSNLVASETIDGLSQSTRRGRPFIAIDCRELSSPHRRVDVAHELGHLVLHRAIDKRFVQANPDTHKLIEAQAFRFAGAFLMPETTFRRALPVVTLDTLLLAKPKWYLSVAAMLHRAQDLGMVSRDSAKKLYINLNRRGWRKKEPLDDQIPNEVPRLLANAVETIRESGRENLAALCDDVGLYPADLARFCGLSEDVLDAGSVSVFATPLRGDRNLQLVD